MADVCFCSVIVILFLMIGIGKGSYERVCIKEETLSRFNNLRGIFALEVVIGHVIRYERTILYPFGKFMIITVAFFFFVSAFGLIVSYESGGADYLSGFLLAKPLYLLILAVMIYLYNILLDKFFLIVQDDFSTSVLHGNFFVDTNWYIWEQILFYFIFYVVFRYCKKKQILIITVCVILAATAAFLFEVPECWYASSFAFPLGLIMGRYYQKLIAFLISWKGCIVTVILIILGLCSLLLPTNNLLGMVWFRNFICIAFIFILIRVLMNFKLGNNSVSSALSRHSTEIYLSQFIYLLVSEAFGWNYKIRLVFVLTFTIASAWILHPLVVKIKAGIYSSCCRKH